MYDDRFIPFIKPSFTMLGNVITEYPRGIVTFISISFNIFLPENID